MPLLLTSPAFTHGSTIPPKFTCDGENVSPPLEWSGVPAGTRSLALLVDDPDAPDPARPKKTWTHWLLYDIPQTTSGLPEGVAPEALPEGTRTGRTDQNETVWHGPCPPIGKHRYYFSLFALDAVLGDLHTPTRAQFLAAVGDHVLSRVELMGTYVRPPKE